MSDVPGTVVSNCSLNIPTDFDFRNLAERIVAVRCAAAANQFSLVNVELILFVAVHILQNKMEKSAHEEIVKEILEHTPEYNKYEHEWSLTRFASRVVLWGIVGSVVGGITQKLFQFLQGDDIQGQSKWKCAGYGVLYLIALAITFYVTLRLVSRQFDDWMMSTISGFIFALSYFAAQTTLSKNIQCLFSLTP